MKNQRKTKTQRIYILETENKELRDQVEELENLIIWTISVTDACLDPIMETINETLRNSRGYDITPSDDEQEEL